MIPIMATSTSIEPSPDSLIRDLHRIREAIVDSYGGDLHALTADLQRQSEESGQPVWRRKLADNPVQPSPESPPVTNARSDGSLKAVG